MSCTLHLTITEDMSCTLHLTITDIFTTDGPTRRECLTLEMRVQVLKKLTDSTLSGNFTFKHALYQAINLHLIQPFRQSLFSYKLFYF